MGFVRGIAKFAASLIGLAMTLAGVVGVFWGIYTIIKGKIGTGIALLVSSILVVTVATFMGKFARGDYD